VSLLCPVRAPRLRPALPAPEHPPVGAARAVRRHRGTPRHVRVVAHAAGLRGGVRRGVLPTGSTRGRRATGRHAPGAGGGGRRQWRAGRGHLPGVALSTVLLLLIIPPGYSCASLLLLLFLLLLLLRRRYKFI